MVFFHSGLDVYRTPALNRRCHEHGAGKTLVLLMMKKEHENVYVN